MKNRLIEIMKGIKIVELGKNNIGLAIIELSYNSAEKIADALIRAGVMLPKFKKGQEVMWKNPISTPQKVKIREAYNEPLYYIGHVVMESSLYECTELNKGDE